MALMSASRLRRGMRADAAPTSACAARCACGPCDIGSTRSPGVGPIEKFRRRPLRRPRGRTRAARRPCGARRPPCSDRKRCDVALGDASAAPGAVQRRQAARAARPRDAPRRARRGENARLRRDARRPLGRTAASRGAAARGSARRRRRRGGCAAAIAAERDELRRVLDLKCPPGSSAGRRWRRGLPSATARTRQLRRRRCVLAARRFRSARRPCRPRPFRLR